MYLADWLALGPMEITVLVVLGVLLFGRKLPEIGKSMGKTIVVFKKGMKGVEDDLDNLDGDDFGSGSAVVAPRPPTLPPTLNVRLPIPKPPSEGSCHN